MAIDLWRTRPFMSNPMGRAVDRLFDEAFETRAVSRLMAPSDAADPCSGSARLDVEVKSSGGASMASMATKIGTTTRSATPSKARGSTPPG